MKDEVKDEVTAESLHFILSRPRRTPFASSRKRKVSRPFVGDKTHAGESFPMHVPTLSAPTVVCVASFFKGNDFIRACAEAGARVLLLTRAKLLGEPWAREALEEVFALRDDGGGFDAYAEVAVHLARRHRVSRVVALEEYDVLTAARLREELALPGMGSTVARRFQDKLSMRVSARAAGVRVPDFVHLLNGEEVAEFIASVPPPWLLKPRTGASAMGMRLLGDEGEVWRAASELDGRAEPAERAPAHLLEHFVPGDVYHVNSLVVGGRVCFADASRYGAPPFEVAHRGGVSTSHTLRRGSAEERRLLAANRKLLAGLGFESGTTHVEFIRGAADGELYFLEAAARIGGAYTAEMVEAATGVNLWREWARIELATPERPYQPPAARRDYGGVAVALARQEWPDTSAYGDPEVVFRARKSRHVGLVVRSPKCERVAELLEDYRHRFASDFLAVAPAESRPGQHL
jgi:biotin carboxylase